MEDSTSVLQTPCVNMDDCSPTDPSTFFHQYSDDTAEGGLPPPPPPVAADADYFFYVSDLDAIRQSWTDDRAFYPSTLTYGLAFVFGLTGNLLVVGALLGDRKSRNVTSTFMVSLALADLLFLLVCVPYETANKFISYWAGGLALCKLAGFVEMLSALCSVLNLTAVSVERYLVIVHPMKSRLWCTMRNTYRTIAVVWFVAIILSAPTLHIMDTTVYVSYNNVSHVTIMSCVDNNVNNDVERIVFAWYQLLVMFLLPVVVILYCYIVVIRVLWTSTKEHAKMTASNLQNYASCKTLVPPSGLATYRSAEETKTGGGGGGGGGSGVRSVRYQQPPTTCSVVIDNRSSSSSQNQMTSHHQATRQPSSTGDVGEARIQIIRMLLLIICIFFCCWGPKLVFNVMKKHQVQALQTESAFYISLVLSLLPYIQSSCNPLIYGFMSSKFRRSLRRSCCCCCCCCGATESRQRAATRANVSSWKTRTQHRGADSGVPSGF